jgi:hypothetical protein
MAPRDIPRMTEEYGMAWLDKNIGKTFQRGAGGMRYWVLTKTYQATIEGQKDSVACEIHATIAGKDIVKGEVKEFHVKFDDGKDRRVFFFFKESGGNASMDAGKSTKEADAMKKFKIGKGEFAEMRAKAIGYSRDVAAQLRGE